MTYAALIQKFLEKIQVIKSLNPAYKKPGDGSNGVCDCIGLLIGAIRRMGLKWTGIHGSNYAARRETVGLSYISKVSELELGDAVYKACDPDGTVRKACNAGKKKRKYDLPDRYKKGKAYYMGRHCGWARPFRALLGAQGSASSGRSGGVRTTGQGTGTAWSREPRIPPSVGTFSELPHLAVAERPRLWGQGLYRSSPLLKNLRVCAGFPSSLGSAGSPRDRTLNLGWLAQPCFWHFVGQRALEHLLGWEREGSTNCTLET